MTILTLKSYISHAQEKPQRRISFIFTKTYLWNPHLENDKHDRINTTLNFHKVVLSNFRTWKGLFYSEKKLLEQAVSF